MAAGNLSLAEFDVVRDSARAHEADRYAAALLAPFEAHADLIALAAFAGEVRRISHVVRDPNLAEIRLAWWRDLIAAGSAEKSGSPVADAFCAALRRHAIPREIVHDWLEALAHGLCGEPPADRTNLLLALRLTEGAAFDIAARFLGGSPDAAEIAAAATAYGLARLGADLPYALARGRMPVPVAGLTLPHLDAVDQAAIRTFIVTEAQSAYSEVQASYARLSQPTQTALLPVALVGPYLRALQAKGHDLAHTIAEVSPLQRYMRIGWAHWTDRI